MRVVRNFIRESLRDLDESSLFLPLALLNAIEQEHQAEPLELRELFAGNLAGEKFSAIAHELDPDFVVISDNSRDNLCLIKKYSGSNIESSKLMSLLSARKIQTNDVTLIDDIVTDTEGWKSSPKLIDYFKAQVAKDSAEVYPSSTIPGDLVAQQYVRDDFYIVPRDIKKFKLPTHLSTDKAKEELEAGDCALSVKETVSFTFNKPVTSKEWALAATCWYSYSTSTAVQGLAGAVGALLGGWFGLGVGIVAADVLLRIPVMIWAHKTGKKVLLYANALYCIIILAFESFAAFKLLKVEKETARLTQAATKAKSAARASVASGGSAARGMTDAAVSKIQLADLQRASSGLAWDQVKILLARWAAEMIIGLTADPNVNIDDIVALFDDPDHLESLVNESQKDLKSYVEKLYPEI